jgi:hypothetical protein
MHPAGQNVEEDGSTVLCELAERAFGEEFICCLFDG